MGKVELLPVTYDPERLLMWADENFRRITDMVNTIGSAAPSGAIIPAGNVQAGTFGANVGNGDYTFPGNLAIASNIAVTGTGTIKRLTISDTGADNLLVTGSGATVRVDG